MRTVSVTKRVAASLTSTRRPPNSTVVSSIFGAGNGVALETDAPGQIGGAGRSAEALAWRVPTQPSMDGNTVDAQVEQAAFAANGVHYQASLSFITAQIRMLRMAINGGQG